MMVILRRVFFGFLWGIALYFVACVATGAIAGGIAGVQDPQNAHVAGQVAGAKAVEALRLYLLGGAALLVAVGTWFGILPGTKAQKPVVSKPDSNIWI